MAVRTQPTLSLGMSARIAEAAALSPSSFHKRYRSPYEIPSPSSSPTLHIQKRYRGTSELVEDTEDESSDLDAEREGLDDEGHDLVDEGHGLEDEGPGLKKEEEEAAPEGQQRTILTVDTATNKPLSLGYRALRCQHKGAERISTFRHPTLVTWVDPKDGRVYTNILTYVPPVVPVQTPPSLEWSSGSLPEPGPRAGKGTVTFEALWRPVLALEAWAGYVDAQMAEMSQARYDDHRIKSLGESKETSLEETESVEN
ncbi:hypothetical protein Tco_0737909 [Tanacetum coccineum]